MRSPSEIIDKQALKRFATFYARNIDELTKVKDEALRSFCDTQTFNNTEYDHFKRGVATVQKFFMDCFQESEQLDAQLEKELKEQEK